MQKTWFGRRGNAKLVSAMGATVLALTACSAAKDDGPSAGGSSADVEAAQAVLDEYTAATSSYPDIPPLEGIEKLKGKTVWYVPIGGAVPSLATFGVGVEQALTAAGLKVQVCDGKFLPTAIASCLSQAKSQGADAVVTGYVDYELVPKSFDDLADNGVPVLLAGATPSPQRPAGPTLAYYDTTETLQLLQKLQMSAVIADSKGTAKVVYVGVTDSPQMKNAGAYGEKYLTDNCSGCKITSIQTNTSSLSKLASQVSAALISNPDTNYVVAEIDPYVEQVIAGVQSAGFGRKVKVAGANGDLAGLQRVEAGNLQFVDPGFSIIYQGWQFGDSVLRMLTQQPLPKPTSVVRLFTSDNVGDLALDPDAYTTIDWFAPKDKDFESSFLTAWGVS